MSPRALGLGSLLIALTFVPTRVARAQDATCETYPGLCGLTVTSLPDNAADLAWAIDVVVVGDGFDLSTGGGLTEWRAQAQLLVDTFTAQSQAAIASGTTPGGVSRAAIFNFHMVDVSSATNDFADSDLFDTALGTQLVSGYIFADTARANLAALNAPDVDVVVMIANVATGTANSFLPTTLARGGSIRISRNFLSISHEMGHALAGLHDEYALSTCATPPTETQLVAKRNVTAEPTCVKFLATTPGFACDVLDRGVSCCVEGAAYCTSGVYRPAPSCQMLDSSDDVAFCPVCRHALDAVLDERALGIDVAVPWAVVTQPVAGAVVGGLASLTAVFYDDFAMPLTVRFDVDGVPMAEASASVSPATASFDSRLLVDGVHELVATSSDATGHESTSFAVSFIIDNSCAIAADCASDGDSCTAESCDADRCVSNPIDACCHTTPDCDDGDACTAQICGVGERCVYQVLNGCCHEDGECGDDNACTTDACVAHGCTHDPLDACPPVPPAPEPEPEPAPETPTPGGGGCGCRSAWPPVDLAACSLIVLAAPGAFVRRRRAHATLSPRVSPTTEGSP